MRFYKALMPVVSLFLLLAFPALGHAQGYLQAVGNPSFGVNIPVPNGYINIANGNLHLEIPVSTLKQRGALNLNERLVYDSRIWQIVQFNNYYWWPLNIPNSEAGWRFVQGNEVGTLAIDPLTQSNENECVEPPHRYVTYPGGSYVYDWTDPTGTVHQFDAAWGWSQMPPACLGYVAPMQQTITGYATDASGYSINLIGTTADPSPTLSILDPEGTQVYPQVIDRFGNYWSPGGTDLIDDLGRTPVITTVNGATTTYDVLAPNGAISNNGTRVRYTVTTEQLTLTTNFNQSSVVEYQDNGDPPGSDHPSITAIQSIQLPDGTSYQFTYDSYGEIQTMTLPTGGVVNYGWTNYQDSYQNVNRWISSSTIDGNTTTYTPSVITQCNSNETGCKEQVNLHRPSGDETVYTLTLDNGAWDTNTVTYQGPATENQAKLSIVNTYDFTQTCSQGCGVPVYITKTSEIHTLPDAGLQTQILTVYANPPSGQVTSWSQWDYFPTGSSPTATPSRQINYTYTGFDVTHETHFDQSGNVASSTTYNYTGTAASTSGIISHGTANAGGPYLTSVVKSNNAPAGTEAAYYTYDDTGSVQTAEDFVGNTTSYVYDGTDTFPTEIHKPDTSTQGVTYHHVTKASYDPNTGAPLSTDDENSVANGQAYTVRYSYEPVEGRLSTVTDPDGGNVSYTYNSSGTEVDKTVAQTAGVSITAATTLDGYGRVVSVASGGILAGRTYDGNGRLYSVSAPHNFGFGAGASTDGVTYTSYDTLDRPTQIQRPDGSLVTNQYTGNVVSLTMSSAISHNTPITHLVS